jgi:hypothetical protein
MLKTISPTKSNPASNYSSTNSSAIQSLKTYVELFNSNKTTLTIVETLHTDANILDKAGFLIQLKGELDRQNKSYLKLRIDAVLFFIQRSQIIDCSKATEIPIPLQHPTTPPINPTTLPSCESDTRKAKRDSDNDKTAELMRKVEALAAESKAMIERFISYSISPIKPTGNKTEATTESTMKNKLKEIKPFDIDADPEKDPFAGFDDESLFRVKTPEPKIASDLTEQEIEDQILMAVLAESAREQDEQPEKPDIELENA